MKKTFKMVDLDCANCAAKMERAISRLEGVHSASVSFMTQKLALEAEEADFPHILEEAQRQVRKIDSHCRIEF